MFASPAPCCFGFADSKTAVKTSRWLHHLQRTHSESSAGWHSRIRKRAFVSILADQVAHPACTASGATAALLPTGLGEAGLRLRHRAVRSAVAPEPAGNASGGRSGGGGTCAPRAVALLLAAHPGAACTCMDGHARCTTERRHDAALLPINLSAPAALGLGEVDRTPPNLRTSPTTRAGAGAAAAGEEGITCFRQGFQGLGLD